jgi:hypothetical protein
MKPFEKDDQLAEDLRALKPTPRPEFTAKLDERAAAGFPRRSRLPRPSLSLPSWSPRRTLIPAGGVAVIAVAIASALVATADESDQQGFVRQLSAPPSAGNSTPGSAKGPQFAQGSGPGAPVEATAEEASPEIEKYQRTTGATEVSAAADVQRFNGRLNLTRQGGQRPRAVERSAQIVLAAEPGDVAEDSRQVFEAVHAHDGIVMRSSTQEGKAGAAGARFELLIPSARLGDALAALSEIDEVRSRSEATADITAPTVNVGELLQDSKARIDSLLGQLEAAEIESEREAVEAELRQERRHRARLRAQLQELQKRADFSRVSLRIETGAAEDSSGGGTWGVDDAASDAGQILSTAAAVTLVALAVLAPIALIALLAWLAHRTWVRRERRRVLS